MAKQYPDEVVMARRIMACEDFVPAKLRFLIFITIIVVYQFTGGVFLSAVTQMAGSMSWINEDIMMAGYATLIGQTITFPVLFRILFRFKTRDILIFVTLALLAGDLICMYSDFVPLVVFVSFVCGALRMVGTFICWNNIQLNITPTRDFAVFFPFLFTFVLGCIQLSNLATGYSILAFDWQAMHFFSAATLLVTFLLIYVTMRRHFRQGLYMPFLGIDYLGGVLWSVFLMALVFISVYGEHYDWRNGKEIPQATILMIISLVMIIHRESTVRHPYIPLDTFRQPNMLNLLFLAGCLTLMSVTSGGLQNIFTGEILHFDTFHNISLNWGSFVGVLAGAGFFYIAVVRYKWRVKTVLFAGFSCFTLYQMMLYFLIDGSIEKNMLYLPMFLKGAGLAVVYISITYKMSGSVSFQYYFQAICVIGFIRTTFGNAMSSALYTHLYNALKQKNMALLSGELDWMNPLSKNFSGLYSEVQRQATMVSLKEVYGYAVLTGILILIFILLFDYWKQVMPNIPKLVNIWKMVKKESET
jgi:hypothetical protein